jgi:hypothetical protein
MRAGTLLGCFFYFILFYLHFGAQGPLPSTEALLPFALIEDPL